MLILGVRAHDFGTTSIPELAGRIGAKGIPSIQLALAKAIAGIKPEPGHLSPGLAHYCRQCFAAHNIQIAVLGCYINPIHPDPVERRRSLERFKEHLRYARAFGCSIVGTETGSLHADCSYHPDNESEAAFRTLVESVAQLVAEAERFGTFVGIEGVTTHTITTPAKMKQLLTAIPSGNLQVIFDPVNLLSPANYQEQDRIIGESFDLFGDKIVAIHSKDFVVEDGRLKLVPVGQGMLHHELLLKTVKNAKPYINFLLEGANPATVDTSLAFLERLYQQV
ncbi:sugar phosphate isomerase/epimerase [Hydrogenispora ethanolica]|uniref:Sugar phosphate isomerase/epimerase n=1 Tax=Hydrogenispora ethanolica TaxID=1082276 RepID=A0A4R1QSL4_HYDET|nr:sugar phosphate isomerase/epimerase family protein [Hydrogenispora ethanolica]TCL56828.1 sugar phosphate isomerase/epimerase [Hydrogenispora ethanolica]